MKKKQSQAVARTPGKAVYLLFALIGGLFGAWGGDLSGAFLGLVTGVLAAEVLSLRNRLDQLEQPVSKRIQDEELEGEVVFQSPLEDGEESISPPRTVRKAAPGVGERKEEEPVKESLVDRFFNTLGDTGSTYRNHLIQFFTSGNLVLKIGVIILFFGVAFLLKYAAQRNMVPIEFRLVGVALGGLVLLGLGWKLRQPRRGYGLVLQGGGVGLIYLVVFAAAKLYGFLPALVGLPVMVGLVAFSCMLSLLQNSKPLAVFAIIGGFLAPVLMSSGGGSHVMLFSYYGLLNCGILGIAWFKAWRELNLIGFVFTFGIGTLWGASGYRPEHFGTTEPFLLMYFLFYLLISVLFAHRQPVKLRGFIDGPLVFGLPLVVSGLQYCLVKDFQYGMAFSALGFGLFYLGMANLLWRRLVDSMHLLCEAFLALGVVFGSLAIPLAFDGHLSASIWALEGAGMVWVGVRQQRSVARHFGIVLQLAAAYIFVDSVWYPFSSMVFLNRYFLGCFFLSLAALFSSFWLEKHKVSLKKWERYFPLPLLTFGLIWWYIGGLREMERQLMPWDSINGFLLFVCITSVVTGLAARRLEWRRLGLSLTVQLPAMVLLVIFALFDLSSSTHLFDGWGSVAWIIAFAVQYRILYLYGETWQTLLREGYHLGTLWLLLFVLCFETAWYIDHFADLSEVWSMVCWGLLPSGALLLLLRLGRGATWPFGRYSAEYVGAGSVFPVLTLCCWSTLAFGTAGDPLPLAYIPLFNPIELTGILVIATLVFWVVVRRNQKYTLPYLPDRYFLQAIGLLFFFWLNSVVARVVHFYVGIPYYPQSLYHSVIFQASIAALWGVSALTLTVWGTRRGNRPLWVAGSVLLGMVVMKLFLVDLSGSGTIGRIVSFLVVGVLMLIIGYFSPLPPRHRESAE